MFGNSSILSGLNNNYSLFPPERTKKKSLPPPHFSGFFLHVAYIVNNVVILYLLLALPLAHSNSIIDNDVIWIICYMEEEPV